jgi:hypothetical protein
MTTLPWLRLYTEFASDPKIQMLAFEDQRHYVMLLCLKGNGTLDATVPSEGYRERLIAKGLGLDPTSASEAKRRLIEGGLIGADWHPLQWEVRQFKSDHDAAERKRNQRARERERESHGVVTSASRDSHDLEQNRADTDSDSDQKTTARKSRAKPEEPAEFLDLKIAYPNRAGDQGWRKALRAISARLDQGYTWQQIIEGAKRYAAYVRSTGSEDTQYVKQACVFVGPDLHFLNDWKLPLTKAGTRLKTNLSAAEEFMRRTEQPLEPL